VTTAYGGPGQASAGAFIRFVSVTYPTFLVPTGIREPTHRLLGKLEIGYIPHRILAPAGFDEFTQKPLSDTPSTQQGYHYLGVPSFLFFLSPYVVPLIPVMGSIRRDAGLPIDLSDREIPTRSSFLHKNGRGYESRAKTT